MSKSKRILITGSTGHLGNRLAELATEWDLICCWHHKQPNPAISGTHVQLDLCNKTDVHQTISYFKPNVIIHTACSNRSEQSIVPASLNIAKAASQNSARIIHLSTDMVLDGKSAPYIDDAPQNPIMSYGKVKAIAENNISQNCTNYAIVRTSLIYGMNPIDHQTKWMINNIKSGKRTVLFTDEIRCPIWIDTLSYCLLELANMSSIGFLNVAGPKPMNRWEIGTKLLKLLNLENNKLVIPGLQSESNLTRPKDLTLIIKKAQGLLKTPLLDLDDALLQIRQNI